MKEEMYFVRRNPMSFSSSEHPIIVTLFFFFFLIIEIDIFTDDAYACL